MSKSSSGGLFPRGRPRGNASAVLSIGAACGQYLTKKQPAAHRPEHQQSRSGATAVTGEAARQPPASPRTETSAARDGVAVAAADADFDDDDMFNDAGLPLQSPQSSLGLNVSCCTSPGCHDGSHGAQLGSIIHYMTQLQAVYGLNQQGPHALSTDAVGTQVFMVPDWNEGDRSLSMQRFLYPSFRRLHAVDGSQVLAQWCNCSPEQLVRKRVLEQLPGGTCSSVELQGSACMHLLTMQVGDS